ncbi:hypothetical protein AAII07_52945, partial [Microvirga sp. 0TCS3.31]
PSRLYCRRVVGVHIAVPGQASAPSWNHSGLGHSTVFGTGSKAKHRDYDFDALGKDQHLTNVSLFYNVIYDNGAAPSLEYGSPETVTALNTYMQSLAAKYAHGDII